MNRPPVFNAPCAALQAALSVMLAALFVSCAGEPAGRIPSLAAAGESAPARNPYIITDYRNKALGGSIPEWVSFYYSGGAAGIETMAAYRDRYVFVSRNEGNNFNALNQWTTGFDAALDFPRLAAARIEARFASGVAFPDYEYGAFYEALIRAASDAVWDGAVREDDFWIRREFISGGEEGGETAAGGDGPDQSPAGPEARSLPAETENWEFLILVSIEKNLFAARLDEIFKNITPVPRPSKDQIAAAGQVKSRFFEGF